MIPFSNNKDLFKSLSQPNFIILRSFKFISDLENVPSRLKDIGSYSCFPTITSNSKDISKGFLAITPMVVRGGIP